MHLQGDNREVGQVSGVAAGIVTNNQDPDGLGRVKVKFPWLSDDNETRLDPHCHAYGRLGAAAASFFPKSTTRCSWPSSTATSIVPT